MSAPAKLHVSFNNKYYYLDPEDDSIESAYDALDSHLANKMNGSGAVINFGGTDYNIDSAKLQSAKDDFISHLRTVAGNDMKVVVGGMEYGIDASKMALTISDIHVALGGLPTIGHENITVEKNEYGFYYNVPYVRQYDNGMFEALVFGENSRFTVFSYEEYNGTHVFIPFFTNQYAYDKATNSILMADKNLVFDSNGLSFDMMIEGHKEAEYDTYGNIIYHGIYYDEEYVNENGDTIVCTNDDIFIFVHNGERQEIRVVELVGNFGYFDNGEFRLSIDGEHLEVAGIFNQPEVYIRKK